jgi:hypothetical protein
MGSLVPHCVISKIRTTNMSSKTSTINLCQA